MHTFDSHQDLVVSIIYICDILVIIIIIYSIICYVPEIILFVIRKL